MLMHNDQCTGREYVEETLSFLALQGWYDIDSERVFNLLSATVKQQSTPGAHLSRLQTIQYEPFIHSVPQQVYYLRETHVCKECRSIKLTSFRDAAEDFGFPNFGQLFHPQIERTGDPKSVDFRLDKIRIYS